MCLSGGGARMRRRRRWGGRSQVGSCFEWQLDSATFPKSTKHLLFSFETPLTEGSSSVWAFYPDKEKALFPFIYWALTISRHFPPLFTSSNPFSLVCLQCDVGAVRRPSLPQSWWCVLRPLCSTCAASPAVFVPAACRPETAASSGTDSYCVPERTITGVWPARPPQTQVHAVYNVLVCAWVFHSFAGH